MKQSKSQVGMHSIWLVRNPDRFMETLVPTSENDKRLEDGLTMSEWQAIFLDVLADKSDAGSVARIAEHYGSIEELGEGNSVPGFPMLSKIIGRLWDVVFDQEEVKVLREECVKLLQSTGNPLAVQGLEKLVTICDQALQMELAICLLCV